MKYFGIGLLFITAAFFSCDGNQSRETNEEVESDTTEEIREEDSLVITIDRSVEDLERDIETTEEDVEELLEEIE